MSTQPFADLPALADDRAVHVVIETAKGSRNKYAFEEKLGVFLLKGVLPEGTSFPYDYGYIPSTKGGDGDPLDILVIMDASAFTGCVIAVKVIGAIEAEQTERDGRTERNDRLIGVATHAHTHDHVEALSDLRPRSRRSDGDLRGPDALAKEAAAIIPPPRHHAKKTAHAAELRLPRFTCPFA